MRDDIGSTFTQEADAIRAILEEYPDVRASVGYLITGQHTTQSTNVTWVWCIQGTFSPILFNDRDLERRVWRIKTYLQARLG